MKRALATAILLISLYGCNPTEPPVETPCCNGAGGEITHTDGAGLWLPGTFTPNTDGLNDTYVAKGNSIDQFSLTIRQGNAVIIQTNDREFSWDGTINGKMVPAGSYQVNVTGNFTQNRPFSLQTHLCLTRECIDKDISACKTGDQFTDRGFITGSVSTDPLVNCR